MRTVLNAVAAVLARHDWSGLFPASEDFVAFIAEHDEGIAEKVESLRAANPPERADRGRACSWSPTTTMISAYATMNV